MLSEWWWSLSMPGLKWCWVNGGGHYQRYRPMVGGYSAIWCLHREHDKCMLRYILLLNKIRRSQRALKSLLPPFQQRNWIKINLLWVVLVGYTKFYPKQSNYVGGVLGHKNRHDRLQIKLLYFLLLLLIYLFFIIFLLFFYIYFLFLWSLIIWSLQSCSATGGHGGERTNPPGCFNSLWNRMEVVLKRYEVESAGEVTNLWPRSWSIDFIVASASSLHNLLPPQPPPSSTNDIFVWAVLNTLFVYVCVCLKWNIYIYSY